MHEHVHIEPGEAPVISLALEGPNPFPLVVERLPLHQPDHHRGMHLHRFAQLVYFETGGGAVRIGGSSCDVHPGDLVLLEAGRLHDLGGLDDGVDAWILSMGPGLPAVPSVVRSVLPADLRPRWSRRIATLDDELHARRRGYRELARHELAAMFIELSRVAPPVPPTPKVSPLTARLLELIERRYADPLTLTDMARALRRSPAYLTSLARTELGRTAMQLVLDRRMKAARERLTGSDELIDVIAERIGFSDPAYFTRLFRREHGMSPRRWRQQQRAAT